MKVHKLTVMIIDHDEIGAEWASRYIEQAHYPNRCISPNTMQTESVEIGEWRDDHPLNRGLAAQEFARLFPIKVEKTGDGSPQALAAYLIEWLRSRNGGELAEAIGDMRVADFENLRGELELILQHGGRPPNWVDR